MTFNRWNCPYGSFCSLLAECYYFGKYYSEHDVLFMPELTHWHSCSVHDIEPCAQIDAVGVKND